MNILFSKKSLCGLFIIFLIAIISISAITTIDASSIPGWIKNNAKWWAQKQIGDSDFISGIQFMIQQKIILVSGTPGESAQGDVPVPEWVRNNAGWWADDQISEDEFVKALEFLIQNGIIRIS